MSKHQAIATLVIGALLIAAADLPAQERGTVRLTGYVFSGDRNEQARPGTPGLPVAEILVTVIEQNTDARVSIFTETDQAGGYELLEVPVGTRLVLLLWPQGPERDPITRRFTIRPELAGRTVRAPDIVIPAEL